MVDQNVTTGHYEIRLETRRPSIMLTVGPGSNNPEKHRTDVHQLKKPVPEFVVVTTSAQIVHVGQEGQTARQIRMS